MMYLFSKVKVKLGTEGRGIVRKMDNAIHRINRSNRSPVDSVVCLSNTYPLDSDLSSG